VPSTIEHTLTIRETNDERGHRVVLSIDGPGLSAPETEEASLSYAVAATLFHLYTNGAVLKEMQERFGIILEGYIELE
jgi:hypothetical protein